MSKKQKPLDHRIAQKLAHFIRHATLTNGTKLADTLPRNWSPERMAGQVVRDINKHPERDRDYVFALHLDAIGLARQGRADFDAVGDRFMNVVEGRDSRIDPADMNAAKLTQAAMFAAAAQASGGNYTPSSFATMAGALNATTFHEGLLEHLAGNDEPSTPTLSKQDQQRRDSVQARDPRAELVAVTADKEVKPRAITSRAGTVHGDLERVIAAAANGIDKFSLEPTKRIERDVVRDTEPNHRHRDFDRDPHADMAAAWEAVEAKQKETTEDDHVE